MSTHPIHLSRIIDDTAWFVDESGNLVSPDKQESIERLELLKSQRERSFELQRVARFCICAAAAGVIVLTLFLI